VQGDYLVNFFAVVSTDPSISYVDDRATSLTGTFSDPLNFNTTDLAGNFGPSFTIVETATPEPGTLVLMALGAGLAGIIRRQLHGRP